MKAEVVLNSLKKRLIKYGIIILVLTVFAAGSGYYNSGVQEEQVRLRNDINTFRSQVVQKEDAYKEAEDNLKKFLEIPKKVLPTKEGYEAGYMRVKVLMPIIEELKKVYKFKKLDLALSDINPSQRVMAETFDTFESTIDLNFQGVSDEYLASFINDLNYRLPGYVDLLKLDVKRENQITSYNIKKYAVDPNFYFVSGTATLSWATFKTKAN